MDEKTPGTLETVDILLNRLTPEQRDALRKVLTSTTVPVRDTPRVDTRTYYHIRVGQFETVVDSRDCDVPDKVHEYAMGNRTQAWYFVDDGNDEPVPLTTKWTHTQYIEWLRR